MIPPGPVVVTGGIHPDELPSEFESLGHDIHIHWGAPSRVSRSMEGVVTLDGVALLGDELHETGETLSRAWGGRSLTEFAALWGNEVSQSGCAFIWSAREGELAMLPDPLGGASLFSHQHGALTVWSTDYRQLIRTLVVLGASPQKDPDYQVERLIFGNGGLQPTSYVGGSRLDIFHGVIVSSNGPRIVRYDSAESLLEDRPYAPSAVALRDQVARAVGVIADTPTEHRICHLTGGWDTRMVLGAVLATASVDKFTFFCSGPLGTPDRDTADGLSRTFGLRRTVSQGITPVTVGPHTSQKAALLDYTAGLSTVGPTGYENELSVLVTAGGLGGLMRSVNKSIPVSGVSAWKSPEILQQVTGGSLTELLSREAADRLTQRLTRELVALHESGVPVDYVPNAFYLNVRNRYHAGAKSLLWSRVGTLVNPLYSVHAIAAARSLSIEARTGNILGLDLLSSFGGDLALYPFDAPRDFSEYRRQRRLSCGKPFRQGAEIRYVKPPIQTAQGEPVGPVLTREQRAVFIERANALKITYWQSVHLEETQADIRRLLDADTGVAAMFNAKYLRELSKTKRWNRKRIRQLYEASAVLEWWKMPVPS